MISVNNLVKDFGALRAVDNVSFDVGQGEVLGFLGPNGAGKSTTMRMITGFLTPTAGTAVINGHDILDDSVAARRQIGYLPENAPAYDDMTVEEFLEFIARMRGYTGPAIAERAAGAMESCFLGDVRRRTIETLSKGYRQRTCFAQAILHDPPVLILDEPTEGLDPNQKHVVRTMIQTMAETKVIVFSTHILEEVDAVCSRVIVISGGELVVDSSPSELRKRSRSYNAVMVRIVAEADQAQAAFSSLPDVAAVEVRADGTDQVTCHIIPCDQQPIASQVAALAQSRGWLLTSIHSDDGRLDDVFRDITSTADVSQVAQQET